MFVYECIQYLTVTLSLSVLDPSHCPGVTAPLIRPSLSPSLPVISEVISRHLQAPAISSHLQPGLQSSSFICSHLQSSAVTSSHLLHSSTPSNQTSLLQFARHIRKGNFQSRGCRTKTSKSTLSSHSRYTLPATYPQQDPLPAGSKKCGGRWRI